MTRPGFIEFREAKVPALGHDEVLLRIRRIGVCGSDVHVWHGKHPFTSYPVVQGHEYSATVEKVGLGVTDVHPGMKATGRPQLVCGVCNPCRRGDYNICNNLKVQGFQDSGCAQDLFVVPRDRLVIFPDNLTYEQGAMVEPTAVAAHATGRVRDLTGHNVVVLGAGTIGNLVAQAARCRGAKKVLITDKSQFRLDKVRACGADGICNIATDELGRAARRVFGNEGFDIAFEAAAAEAALDSAIQSIEKGGLIVAVGVFEQRPQVDMSVLGDRELTLTGTLMYKHEDYEQAVRWIASGEVQTTLLITTHFPFERYNDAYRFIEDRGDETLKVMVDVN